MESKILPNLRFLMTPKQAADALAISERKLWSMTQTGDVPHIRLGRSVRYPVGDIQQWIEKRKQGGDDR